MAEGSIAPINETHSCQKTSVVPVGPYQLYDGCLRIGEAVYLDEGSRGVIVSPTSDMWRFGTERKGRSVKLSIQKDRDEYKPMSDDPFPPLSQADWEKLPQWVHPVSGNSASTTKIVQHTRYKIDLSKLGNCSYQIEPDGRGVLFTADDETCWRFGRKHRSSQKFKTQWGISHGAYSHSQEGSYFQAPEAVWDTLPEWQGGGIEEEPSGLRRLANRLSSGSRT